MQAACFSPYACETDIKRAINVEQRIGLRFVLFSSVLFSSDDSDNEWRTNRDLIVPSPFEWSDSNDDCVSLSQHKLAKKKQLAEHHVVPNSTSGTTQTGSDGKEFEEEEVEEEDVEQSIDGQSGTAFESTMTAAIFRGLPR
jgi:hypothetical protein